MTSRKTSLKSYKKDYLLIGIPKDESSIRKLGAKWNSELNGWLFSSEESKKDGLKLAKKLGSKISINDEDDYDRLFEKHTYNWILTIVNTDCDDESIITTSEFDSFEQAKEELISHLEDCEEEKIIKLVSKWAKESFLCKNQYILKIEKKKT